MNSVSKRYGLPSLLCYSWRFVVRLHSPVWIFDLLLWFWLCPIVLESLCVYCSHWSFRWDRKFSHWKNILLWYFYIPIYKKILWIVNPTQNTLWTSRLEDFDTRLHNLFFHYLIVRYSILHQLIIEKSSLFLKFKYLCINFNLAYVLAKSCTLLTFSSTGANSLSSCWCLLWRACTVFRSGPIWQ